MATATRTLDRTGGTSAQGLSLALRVIRAGPALILALLVVILTLASPYFFTGDNLSNVLVQVAPLACLAIGQLFVILVGGIDLSVGSVLALCTVTGVARLRLGRLRRRHPLLVAVILLTGVAVGALNGIMLRQGQDAARVHPDARDAERRARARAAARPTARRCPGMPPIVQTAGAGELGPIPVPVLIVAGFGAAAWIFTTRIQLGPLDLPRRRRQGGGAAHRHPGRQGDHLRVRHLRALGAASRALITAGRTDAGYPSAGQLDELAAISAVIIGGAAFWGGRGTVGGAIVGVLIFGVISNGLNLLNVSVYLQLIAIGVIVAWRSSSTCSAAASRSASARSQAQGLVTWRETVLEVAGSPSSTARRSRCATSRSSCARARSSRCWATTAPASRR